MVANIAELEKPIDVAELKQSAAGCWPEILASVAGIDPDFLDQRHHACPKCGGSDRFRFIDPDVGAVLCNQCFHEGNGDGFAAIQWMLECDFPKAYRLVSEYLGTNGNARVNGNGRPNVVEEIAQRKRVPLESWRAFGAHEARRGKLTVCRVPMYDEHGEHCSSTDFATIDEKWLKGMASKAKPSGLYLKGGNVPQAGETVLIVEGPKDAASVHELGFNVIGLPTSSMPGKFARLFRGVHVVVIPDRDEPGEAGAKKTAARLAGSNQSDQSERTLQGVETIL